MFFKPSCKFFIIFSNRKNYEITNNEEKQYEETRKIKPNGTRSSTIKKIYLILLIDFLVAIYKFMISKRNWR